jgi:hypothetical protein
MTDRELVELDHFRKLNLPSVSHLLLRRVCVARHLINPN